MTCLRRVASALCSGGPLAGFQLVWLGISTFSGSVLAQDITGTPINGTVTLTGGFLPDPHVTAIVPGGGTQVEDFGAGCTGYIFAEQPDLELVLESPSNVLGIFVKADIDTTLVINAPDGTWHCNDDSGDLGGSNPGILFDAPDAGTYDIWVGTYEGSALATSGKLVITEWNSTEWAGLNLDAARSATVVQTAEGLQQGSLDASDATLAGYGYLDEYVFDGSAGTTAVLDLRSTAFDTFLQVQSPSGEIFTNDDYEGSYERSLLVLPLTESGEYRVQVTSYDSGATGAYSLAMTSTAAGATTAGLDVTGALAADDPSYSDGEYYDSWTFEGTPGQTVTIDLTSSDFDTYLILEAPGGAREVNDDAEGSSHSQIITQLEEPGTYTVYVTSYEGGETGSYALKLDQGSGQNQAASRRDSVAIEVGDSTRGALEASDQLSEDGKYEDVYVFSGNAGDTVSVDLRSSAFDTYLSMITPAGQTIANDDFDGRTDRSLIDVTLQETGRYRIVATTYAGGATGAYALALTQSAAQQVSEAQVDTGGARIYGIFAGIADYPGDANDLALTDQDALRARDALIEGAGMNPDDAWTLIDSDATNANFRNALASINRTIGADDMLVIFYSGHGSRVERPGGPVNTDPDGFDETIELYDGSLLDDELAALLDGVDAGTVLLVFDSCFSGGFAKDVVSAPGRMGLFSSEEDVTSQVAFKFQAGGYLAAFFDEAIRGGYADQDRNNELTAIELSQYLHDRYRADVKSFGADQYVQTAGPQSSYQHLVVDRGGVGAYNVLFRH